MKKHARKLDIFTRDMVKGKCNIRNFHNLSDEFEFSICQRCPFLTERELCQWYEYKTLVKKDFSDTDGDDFGGLPSTAYGWIIGCACCDHDIIFTSGYSHLWYGDNEKCRKCGLRHYFLMHGKKSKEKIFVVPASEYDKLYQRKKL